MAARLPATLLILILLGLLIPASALAGPVLVLGFLEDGKPNARLRQNVIQFLQRMGEEVVGVALSPSDQLCTQTDCLARIGEHHQAQRLIGGDLIANDTSYRINVWLFDRVSELPNSAEAVCTDCTAEMLSDTVSRTAGHVLELGLGPGGDAGSGHGMTTQPSATPVAARSGPSCTSPYRNFERGLAIGSMAALTGAGLVTGLVLVGHDGQAYPAGEGQPSLTYDLASYYQLTFSLTAVSAVGLAAAAIPWHRWFGPKRAENCATPRRRSFGRGLAVGALGTFGALGIISAIALTAKNDTPYAQNPDGTPVTYFLKPHYSAAFGVSAGMIAGLALALFLPGS